MFKKVLLSSLLVACTISAMADDRSESEMQRLASAKLQSLFSTGQHKVNGDNFSASSLSEAFDMPQLKVYRGNNGGFVVISKDDQFAPILAYSTNSFPTDNMPCCLEWWLKATSDGMSKALLEGNQLFAETSSVSYTPVAPLITTRWGQSGVFSDKTPLDNNKHTPTGCVATAMAQILTYYKYPASAEFTGSFSLGENGANQKQYVNSTYNYDLPDGFGIYYVDGVFQNNRKYTDEQKDMVSTLMLDCGLSVKMNYAAAGSGATEQNFCNGFVNCFSYPRQSVKVFNRMVFNTEEWRTIIYDDLARGCPILYSGATTENAGHAFVAHGVDEHGYLAINWGWSGSGDGFFNMDVLNSQEGSYSEGQSIVVGIRPEALPTDREESLFGFVRGVDYMYSKFMKSIQISGASYNVTGYDFDGILKYVFVDETDGSIQESVIADCREQNITAYYGINTEITVKINTDGDIKLKPGHSYVVYGCSQTKVELEQGTFSLFRNSTGVSGNKFWFYVKINDDSTASIEMVEGDLPETTSIKHVTSSQHTPYIYNIMGQSVDNSYRGIVIKDGKKYFSK